MRRNTGIHAEFHPNVVEIRDRPINLKLPHDFDDRKVWPPLINDVFDGGAFAFGHFQDNTHIHFVVLIVMGLFFVCICVQRLNWDL